jgi:hypothetical protein
MNKKFNGYEMWLITEGLKLAAKGMKEEIRKTEESGKMPLMTPGYVDMITNDLI